MTTITEQLATLESALITQKSRFANEATHSDEKLQLLLDRAIGNHRSKEIFTVEGPRAFALLFQEKINLGWSYVDEDNGAFNAGRVSSIVLVKPPEMVKAEHAALEKKVQDEYRSGIDALRIFLVADIASTQLQINELKANIKLEDKREAEYQKVLASVQQDLCPTDTQKPSTNITHAIVPKETADCDMEVQQ